MYVLLLLMATLACCACAKDGKTPREPSAAQESPAAEMKWSKTGRSEESAQQAPAKSAPVSAAPATPADRKTPAEATEATEKVPAPLPAPDLPAEAYKEAAAPVEKLAEPSFRTVRRELPAHLIQTLCSSSDNPVKTGRGRAVRYEARGISDGKLDVAWVEGGEGDGIGEWVEIVLFKPYKLMRIEVLNGYQKVRQDKFGDRYEINQRVREVEVKIGEDESFAVRLQDERSPQPIDLKGSQADRIRLTIRGVYQAKYDDTAISEVRLFVEEQVPENDVEPAGWTLSRALAFADPIIGGGGDWLTYWDGMTVRPLAVGLEVLSRCPPDYSEGRVVALLNGSLHTIELSTGDMSVLPDRIFEGDYTECAELSLDANNRRVELEIGDPESWEVNKDNFDEMLRTRSLTVALPPRTAAPHATPIPELCHWAEEKPQGRPEIVVESRGDDWIAVLVDDKGKKTEVGKLEGLHPPSEVKEAESHDDFVDDPGPHLDCRWMQEQRHAWCNFYTEFGDDVSSLYGWVDEDKKQMTVSGQMGPTNALSVAESPSGCWKAVGRHLFGPAKPPQILFNRWVAQIPGGI